MDYEKKYKEALEWMRGVYPTLQGAVKKEAERYFPELKESEDEKIRKWCISHFRECFRVTKDNVEYQEYLNNKVIPWFEKQGEKGANGNNEKIPDSEQKTAWSEEDERIYNRIYDLIHSAAYANYDVDEDENECGEYAKIIEWFKDLKDRYTWRPSGAQIASLTIACDRNDRIGFDLTQLLNDLKKLKG